MKTVLTIIGILILLIIAELAGYSFASKRGLLPGASTSTPSASPTPTSSNPLDDLIILDAPLEGASISSPLKITGRARGTWYFEASFPVVLTDWDGLIIAETHADAKSDWMTTDWVPFEATITFSKPAYGSRGSLILKKDNPSGLPEHDAAREITIFFK